MRLAGTDIRLLALTSAPVRARNTVERGFTRLKQRRGIATRYDKHAHIYLAAILLNHRTRI